MINTSCQFISETERKSLISLVLLLCCIFYSHLSITIIEEYNEKVRFEQADKFYKASTSPDKQISFSHCFWSPPLLSQIYWFQFFLNPFFFLIVVKKPSFNRLTVISLFNFFFTFSLFYWLKRNLTLYLINETRSSDYFGQISNISSIFLALIQFSFLVIVTWLIIRFVIERFQAKIELE